MAKHIVEILCKESGLKLFALFFRPNPWQLQRLSLVGLMAEGWSPHWRHEIAASVLFSWRKLYSRPQAPLPFILFVYLHTPTQVPLLLGLCIPEAHRHRSSSRASAEIYWLGGVEYGIAEERKNLKTLFLSLRRSISPPKLFLLSLFWTIRPIRIPKQFLLGSLNRETLLHLC